MMNGYKTYLVAAILIAAVVVEKLLGVDIPGFNPGDEWLTYVLNAAGLGALRNAIR